MGSASMIRAKVKEISTNAIYVYHLAEDSTVQDLATAISEDSRVTSVRDIPLMRLIANGKEMGLKESLMSLGEFYFVKNVVCLLPLDVEACREWQRVGRCSKGCKCEKSATHVVGLSPRYVAYQLEEASPPSSPPQICSLADASPQQSSQSPCGHEWMAYEGGYFQDQGHVASSHISSPSPQWTQEPSPQQQWQQQSSPQQWQQQPSPQQWQQQPPPYYQQPYYPEQYYPEQHFKDQQGIDEWCQPAQHVANFNYTHSTSSHEWPLMTNTTAWAAA